MDFQSKFKYFASSIISYIIFEAPIRTISNVLGDKILPKSLQSAQFDHTAKYHAVYGCYLLEPPIVHKSLLYEITNTEESLELNCTILHKTSPNVIQESLTEKCQKAQSHKWLSNLTSIGSWFL